MPHCGMGASGSSAAAFKKDRSASRAQNECICARPWSKNSCAFADLVAIARWARPCPGNSFAGKDGRMLEGGATQRSSLGFGCWAAKEPKDPHRAATLTFDLSRAYPEL